jgi:hypothetical protein
LGGMSLGRNFELREASTRSLQFNLDFAYLTWHLLLGLGWQNLFSVLKCL